MLALYAGCDDFYEAMRFLPPRCAVVLYFTQDKRSHDWDYDKNYAKQIIFMRRKQGCWVGYTLRILNAGGDATHCPPEVLVVVARAWADVGRVQVQVVGEVGRVRRRRPEAAVRATTVHRTAADVAGINKIVRISSHFIRSIRTFWSTRVIEVIISKVCWICSYGST